MHIWQEKKIIREKHNVWIEEIANNTSHQWHKKTKQNGFVLVGHIPFCFDKIMSPEVQSRL